MNGEKYIGLDVHQATISVAVLDSSGKLVMESILESGSFDFAPSVVRTANLRDGFHNSNATYEGFSLG